MGAKLNITILAGGPSAEREVSLRSGAGVARALRSLGYRVNEVDPRDGTFTLPEGIDVVFLALHGTYGEDGTVQRQLEELGVPYTGCDAEASRIAFDKLLTKERCVQAGVPTAKHVVIASKDAPWPAGWQPPVVIKPVRQGSSVGLQFVDRESDWSSALEESLRHDTEVLVEERILGRETTVGILDDAALPIVEVRPRVGAYDYRNKYTAGCTEYFCPAEFDPTTTRRIQDAALRAFRSVGGRDYGRVDVMVRPEGEPVVLEVNTLPGMTETSLLPKAAAAVGIGYAELCERMIEMAWKRGRSAAKVTNGHVV
ncbi:MAG TPA: D-alanine--D-alanine ligase [Verrucomicrobia bacterium]|nr:D-alanine--D-alanine ligase [Verrucomicrobiota bacterium]HOP97239.1 D-alanine--D-alanine ligase [Verrucomicrobiota bacterium]HPU55163.1 D-alanine--D-alanine ligase [Verrucomicrobiota bacterium]